MAVILPDVPNTCRIVHKGSLNGLPYVNTMHIQADSGPLGPNALQGLATAVHTAYFNAFIPQLNTTTELVSTTVIDLTNRQAGFAIDDTIHVGTVAGTQLPPNSVAYCISWTISDRYRGGHPRMYMPAASGTDYTTGRLLTDTKQQALSAAASGYLAALGAITVDQHIWTPVCVRYYSQHLLLISPLVRPIRDAVVHKRIDSMRRRTGKEVG